jgi:hypothetical protein
VVSRVFSGSSQNLSDKFGDVLEMGRVTPNAMAAKIHPVSSNPEKTTDSF